MKTRIMLALAVVCVAALPTLAQGPRRDGKWEVKTEMEMPNMPNMPAGMTMPSFTSTQCVTPAEAPDSHTGVMKMNRGGQQMTMTYTGKRLGDCDKK